MKDRWKGIIKKALFLLLLSLIYLGIGIVVAILIAKRFDNNLQDVMTCEGLLVIVVGALMSMKGNPSGVNISNFGTNSANMTSFLDNEVTSLERKNNPYNKDYFRNNVIEMAFGNLVFLIGGSLIFLFSIIFL